MTQAPEQIQDTDGRRIDPEVYPSLSQYALPLPEPAGAIIGREAEVQEVLASLNRPRLSNLLLLAPPGSGKLLPLTEPIPTPSGWTTMGQLSVGDLVLGQDGKPTAVTFLSEIEPDPELYDVTFSDGSVVTACADHQWKVSSRSQREAAYPSRQVRTAQLRGADDRRRVALLELAEAYAGSRLTPGEIIDLVRGVGVPNWAWNNAAALDNYLKTQDLVRYEGERERPKRYRGQITGVKMARAWEYDALDAFTVLAHQPRRHKSWAADGSVTESVLTTRQMLEAGVCVDHDGRANFAVRVAAPLELPQVQLPMDPYVLGVWLGDGKRYFTNVASITSADDFVVQKVSERGYPLRRVEIHQQDNASQGYHYDRLGADLKKTGFVSGGARFIPQEYLRASYEQRLELLRGLLDTDGFIDDNGAIELSFSTTQLAEDAEELIRTLGIKVTRKVSEAGYRDAEGEFIQCQDRHRMHFTTDLPVFTLPRRRSKLPTSVRKTQNLLYIESIEPVVSVPGRCIQVDNADHMYLAGRGMVPTHNTVLVQETMSRDPERIYLEVDLARLRGGVEGHQMAAEIKQLFDEAERYGRSESRELVLFIDELHQVVQMDAAAVEALKPVLAASGARGLKIIGATTYDEWIQYIRPNKPLDERLQRVNLAPAGRMMTIGILRSFADEEGLTGANRPSDALLGEIHDLTELHVPSSVQPRKSIGVLDGMIGWHRQTGAKLDHDLLAKVMRQTTGVDIGFKVDGAAIQAELDKKVFAQQLATKTLSDRLQLVVAGLNNPTKPKGRFLLAGSTGTGKALRSCELVSVFDESSGGVRWKTQGELEIGDKVFDREGRPTEVLGVYPQGLRQMYRVTFTDGRVLDADGEHIWTVYTAKQRSKKHAGTSVTPMDLTTSEMIDRGVVRTYPGDSREHLKFFIPMNGAVQWPERDVDLDPYALGVLLGNGCLRDSILTVSSGDEYTVEQVAASTGARVKKLPSKNYSWVFVDGTYGPRDKLVQTRDALAQVPDLIGAYSGERRIPELYMTGSVEQRWELVRGLFDTDGHIGGVGGRYNVSYSTTSEDLAQDVRTLLFSLGVSNTVTSSTRERDGRQLVEFHVHVKVANQDKEQFFALPRKKEIARQAVAECASRMRVKKFDMVGISSIEELPGEHEAVCILVDNEEHLYQAGEHFLVTHNTELTKQLAELVVGDDPSKFIRFDMSEFARKDDMNLFRSELTKKVISAGQAVILLDEVEKADRAVLRLLLQVLDDGRLSDDNGRVVSFLDCYIVMTTNAGSEVFETIGAYAADDTGSGAELKDFMKTIENAIRKKDFPPELLGRLDRIIPFQPLSDATKRKILQRGLDNLRTRVMERHGVRLGIHSRVMEYLAVDVGDDDVHGGGARESLRALEQEVSEEVAKHINAHPESRMLLLSIEGQMRAEDQTLRNSRAWPKVEAASF